MNVPLLRKMVEWVEEQVQLPASKRVWHQEVWGCDTAMCIAGKVCFDAGWKFGKYDSRVVKDGLNSTASEEARRLLGLTYDQGTDLFLDTIEGTPEETAAAIRRVAEILAGERL